MQHDIFNGQNLINYISQEYKIYLPDFEVRLDTSKINALIQSTNDHCYHDDGKMFFPSVFKKMAYFTSHFIHEDMSKSFLPNKHKLFLKEENNIKYREFSYFSSAYFAFMFSILCMHNSKIMSVGKTISNKVELSNHSFMSILTSFSQKEAAENPHIVRHSYALLYEQLIYKTNLHLQYECFSI